MSKRMIVNLVAAIAVMLGGATLGFASPATHVVRSMQTCSGGGGTCSCDAGQTCYSNSSGCQCN